MFTYFLGVNIAIMCLNFNILSNEKKLVDFTVIQKFLSISELKSGLAEEIYNYLEENRDNRELVIKENVSKSFSVVAISFIIFTFGFFVILDAMKYVFKIEIACA